MNGKNVDKACRKAALIVHPDKHPEDQKAAEMFNVATATMQDLTNDAKRQAYDADCQAAGEAYNAGRQEAKSA